MYKSSLKVCFILFLSVCSISDSFSQENKKIEFLKTGFQFNKTSRDNFYFEEEDYAFDIYVFKFQKFYKLRDLGKWEFIAVPQLQYQYIEHQLLNKFFVQDFNFGENFLEFRNRYLQPKNFSFYAFEIGFQLKRNIFNNFNFEFTAGLGAGYIDLATERLASGFTFLENLSFGLSTPVLSNEIYLGFLFNHISNFNTQDPNSGYNTLGWEIGYRF
jgi:hypothetical protein